MKKKRRLITLEKLGELYYTPRSRPTMKRLRRLAAAGEIPGATRENGRWLVDVDDFDPPNALVRKILEGGRLHLVHCPKCHSSVPPSKLHSIWWLICGAPA